MATTTISGTTDVEDTYLAQSNVSFQTDKNYGAATDMQAFYGYDSSEDSDINRHQLIRCSQASIPSGTITGFRLKIYTTTMAGTVSAWVVKDTNTWVEGTANQAAQAGSSCWDKRIYNTTNWAGSVGCNTSGTDYFANASPPSVSGATGLKTFTLATSVADDWKSGAVAANGLVMKPNPYTYDTGLSGSSTESGANQPYWEVDYTPATNITAIADYYRRRR